MKLHPASQSCPTAVHWWFQKVAATATPHKHQGLIIFTCVGWEKNNVIDLTNNKR